jgi:hypothetical protein
LKQQKITQVEITKYEIMITKKHLYNGLINRDNELTNRDKESLNIDNG